MIRSSPILLLLFSLLLFAQDCTQTKKTYEVHQIALRQLSVNTEPSKRYKANNDFIDSATAYLAFCLNDRLAPEYFEIQIAIRRASKKRAELADEVVREFWRKDNVKPIVNTIFQSY